jgi:hypothetical protein
MSRPQQAARRNTVFTIDSENNITAYAALPAGADESQAFSTAKEQAKLTIHTHADAGRLRHNAQVIC